MRSCFQDKLAAVENEMLRLDDTRLRGTRIVEHCSPHNKARTRRLEVSIRTSSWNSCARTPTATHVHAFVFTGSGVMARRNVLDDELLHLTELAQQAKKRQLTRPVL
jgi:hypothetical protein